MKNNKESVNNEHVDCGHGLRAHNGIVDGDSVGNKGIALAIVINIGITVSEIVIGLFIGSLALVSDAVHNFSDVGSLGLSWWGEKVKERKSTTSKTYGYKRAEIIIALFNAMTLLAVVVFIFIEAIKRLSAPNEIASGYMIVMAMVALVGNGIATYILEKDAHKNLNMKSAWMHSLQDALFSLGVVVGAVLIYYFHWYIIDPVISILLSIYILKVVYGLIKETVDILMESVPVGVDFSEVKTSLEKLPAVIRVSDLHIWQTDSNSRLLSAHIKTEDVKNGDRNKLLKSIQDLLLSKFEISHTTIQLVANSGKDEIDLNCEHCN